MTYRPEWKGRVRYSGRRLFIDGRPVAAIIGRHVEGAQTHGGYPSNLIWDVDGGPSLASLDLAIQHLFEQTR